ncbi:MAG TPA: endonuclease V [Candidatus Nanoarchaeia archaeon]|nr:endonuclease V [Candidatus Nanoarchaeia archaeon]
MDLVELKREQAKLSYRVKLENSFQEIKTIGAAECQVMGSKLLATVVVCEFPSFKVKEQKSYLLGNPLPYKQGFVAYREMPAIIEAVNQLDEEPDLLLVKGEGIVHPRGLGIAAHLGLELNLATIGIQDSLTFGDLQDGKILIDGQVAGFEIKTKEFSNPLFISPGHNVSLETIKEIIPKTIIHPHKLPEPLHLAHKLGRKLTRKKE